MQACPPSAGYRFRKFARRNKRPVLAGATIIVLLVGGVIGTTLGMLGERQAKELAHKRLGQIEKANEILGSRCSRTLTRRRKKRAARPCAAILGERLDQAAKLLDGEAVGDPIT